MTMPANYAAFTTGLTSIYSRHSAMRPASTRLRRQHVHAAEARKSRKRTPPPLW
jgi:hypothetical protein